jgi:SAM-dependent methyltransferase
MSLAERSVTIARGILKRYGSAKTKKRLWDQEFSGSHWDFIDNTAGDCVYPYLEKYAKNGAILDLGCGPGNTANELANSAYQTYLGVDISEAALVKARRRTEECGRAAKNYFVQGDFINYEPRQTFDLILFRESMYHVPLSKVKPMLERYSSFLKKDGVFVVRMVTLSGRGERPKRRLTAMVEIIKSECEVLEHNEHGEFRATVIVFRPKNGLDHSLADLVRR